MCLLGLEPKVTSQEVLDILYNLGFDLTIDCVRIPRAIDLLESKAMLKVKDPLFTTELSSKLKDQGSKLGVTPIPLNIRRTNCRKLYIS